MSLIQRCPHFRGQNVHNPNVWDSTSCPVEGCQGVLIRGVSLFQGVLIEWFHEVMKEVHNEGATLHP